jgi:SAM-dependent methyltransferase
LAEKLKQTDLTAIRELYETRFRELGETVATVGWGCRESQTLRFQQLFRGLDVRGKRILDFGCGFADLIPYLDETCDGQFDYVGIELCEGILDVAAKRYSDRGFRFIAGDLLALPGSLARELECDIAVSSGAFSFRIADNVGYTTSVIRRLCEIASEVVSVNFLTSHVDFQLKKNHHYCPAEMLQFALTCSRRVAIYHDYPLWEFTIQVYCDRQER